MASLINTSTRLVFRYNAGNAFTIRHLHHTENISAMHNIANAVQALQTEPAREVRSVQTQIINR